MEIFAVPRFFAFITPFEETGESFGFNFNVFFLERVTFLLIPEIDFVLTVPACTFTLIFFEVPLDMMTVMYVCPDFLPAVILPEFLTLAMDGSSEDHETTLKRELVFVTFTAEVD